MAAIKIFITRHPALTYFVLTFAISWGGFLMAIGPSGLSVVELPPAAILSMVAGPIVAGLLMTGLVYGKAGYGEFRAQLFTWRVGTRWYAVALLIAPLVITTLLLALSRISPAYLPGIITASNKVTHLLSGLAVGLAAGFLEEIGWTGFAVPTLRRRYGVLTTGLIVGALWGAWHILGNIAAAGSVAGTLSVAVFLPLILLELLIGSLVAFRVLMVWVYDRTQSLFLAMLMHVSLTASIRILSPLPNEGAPLLIYTFLLAVALWMIVAVVTLANHGQLSRPPLQKQSWGGVA